MDESRRARDSRREEMQPSREWAIVAGFGLWKIWTMTAVYSVEVVAQVE
jgi:hypothetical protein